MLPCAPPSLPGAASGPAEATQQGLCPSLPRAHRVFLAAFGPGHNETQLFMHQRVHFVPQGAVCPGERAGGRAVRGACMRVCYYIYVLYGVRWLAVFHNVTFSVSKLEIF